MDGAHPRVCGADKSSIATYDGTLGSSPRVRGRPRRDNPGRWVGGLIPACAGQTQVERSRRGSLEAHPRVCGADTCRQRPGVPARGSSPRVRGRQNLVTEPEPGMRLIPACAGQTEGGAGGAFVCAAHPRVCGADVTDKPEEGEPTGLIPACAGQTTAVKRGEFRFWAHPRVCGADIYSVDLDEHTGGSSPRVRGRLAGQGRQQPLPGLIPACAGQTCLAVSWACWVRAHPRVCGADRRLTAWLTRGLGSSPRVRGRRAVVAFLVLPLGLIPACAGQTSSW